MAAPRPRTPSAGSGKGLQSLAARNRKQTRKRMKDPLVAFFGDARATDIDFVATRDSFEARFRLLNPRIRQLILGDPVLCLAIRVGMVDDRFRSRLHELLDCSIYCPCRTESPMDDFFLQLM